VMKIAKAMAIVVEPCSVGLLSIVCAPGILGAQMLRSNNPLFFLPLL
jgi:hypothetical protein